MKLISLTLSALLFAIASISACASTPKSKPGATQSNKAEDHQSKFQKYFKVHTSMEHRAEMKAAEERAQAKREQNEQAAAQKMKAAPKPNTTPES